MHRIAIRMQQRNRQRLHPRSLQFTQLSAGWLDVQRDEDRPVSGQSFIDLNDTVSQRHRLANGEFKQLRAGLIPDQQQVTKPARGDEPDPGPAAFQQGVRPACGAEPHLTRGECLPCPVAQQIPYP